MIESLRISGVASYEQEAQTLSGLSKFNFNAQEVANA
jgi:hypothetical protein